MRSEKIKVLYKTAGKTMREKTIPNTLEVCQELVGGYIEIVPLMPDIILVCNEEGRLKKLPDNSFAGRNLVGDWFICGTIGEKFADVPRAYEKIVKQFMTIRKEGEDA